MPSYTVTVSTGSQWFAGTDDYIYITLVGTERCSERTLLDKPLYNDFERGAVDSYDVRVGEDLGDIVLVKIEKKKYWVHDDWYCRYITVKTPSGEYLEFPCFRWLVDEKEVVLRDGRAHLPQDDKTSLVKQHRQKELDMRRKTYRWKEWQPGFPMSIDANRHKDLPRDIQFDSEKGVDFVLNYSKAIENLFVNHFMHMFQSSWNDFADFEKIFVRIKNTISEYVMQHWREDFMFGYQFLNGCNPVIIKKCTKLPEKFPVTHEMVSVSLERDMTLQEEIEAGNIYIADYEVLDGISPNSTDPCTLQYLAAPICLLYKTARNKILPIAIQLGQTPGKDNPIFLPTDGQYDWLLAKIWVRSADFHHHQTITHLLRTHLITEVFAIAMYRQLPAVHPVYKLLTPHIRFTIAINTKAREQLICECGIFDKVSFGAEGSGSTSLFNLSVFFRFVEDLGACTCFVSDVVHIYYTSDEAVQADEEIQAFIKDVCSFGMQDFDHCEFPKSVKSREELAEYLTVIVFTASAQHAAVNFGQLYLGMYPDEHFIEKPVKEAMEKFRKQLAEVTSSIKRRNDGKRLPYYNMSPDKIPNSVAV
uniref:Arachidonate 5-lipoxygenase b, tandem duplicate 2 n=1 Tax=Sparus aurata TaxID=8175 RepID=A0A671YQF7_SPAAU